MTFALIVCGVHIYISCKDGFEDNAFQQFVFAAWCAIV